MPCLGTTTGRTELEYDPSIAMEPPLQMPASLDEVISLIRAFYEPNPPQTISRIQSVLHGLQRSPEGWKLAQSLMTSSNDNVKFFGALTLIIKLNRDSKDLGEEDAKSLLEKLIGWLLQTLQDGSGALVIRKLCTALVTYLIHFTQFWSSPVSQLVHCLHTGRSLPADSFEDSVEMKTVVTGLSSQALHAVIWFASVFVEEVGKTDMTNSKYINAHARLVKSASDIALLLSQGLSAEADPTQVGARLQIDALGCFKSWILYAQRLSANEMLITPLRGIVDSALRCLGDKALYEAAVDFFTDVLSYYSGFFTCEHYQHLSGILDSPWAQERYQHLLVGSYEEDGTSFGLLMLAYGDARVSQLLCNKDDRSQRLLTRLGGLLTTQGYPVGEDQIFVPALEFWSTFVEVMVDAVFSNGTDTMAWKAHADAHIQTVVMNCWRKVQWPPAEVFASWDSSERVAFSEARKDVADLLQSVYSLSGKALVAFFADAFVRSIPSQNWAEVEASAFCLSSLSDCPPDLSECDDELARVFSSPLFEFFGQPGQIPLRLRQTALSLIERYSEYFEKHAEFLPYALNLLFAAMGDPALGGPSARSIATLCCACRSLLAPEIDAFIGQYKTIRKTNIDSIAEEKLVLAMASIIQNIGEEDARLVAFEQLYTLIREEIEQAFRLGSQPGILDMTQPVFQRGIDSCATHASASTPKDVAVHLALRSLRCLGSMAKGMQHVIDLEEDDTKVRVRSTKLIAIQNDIVELLMAVRGTFSTSGDVVEAICHILRAGFSEVELGPFVFPPEYLVDFFVSQPFESPRLGTLIITACGFVGSLFRGPRDPVSGHLLRLLPWVISLLQALSAPDVDTEVAQNGIYFVDRVMARCPEVVLQLQPPSLLEFFLVFTLQVLNGKELLPKTAAADFWTNFISFKPQDPTVQVAISSAMDTLGPLVAQALVQNFGGNAARSELDKLSDPFKKLVVQQVGAQKWLERALLDPSFPSQHVSQQDRLMFLRKAISLRGSKATNQVLRDFWLTCRGSTFAYAS